MITKILGVLLILMSIDLVCLIPCAVKELEKFSKSELIRAKIVLLIMSIISMYGGFELLTK